MGVHILESLFTSHSYISGPVSSQSLKMFELWKQSVTEDNFTYSVLAAALEKHGFRRAAHKYCYVH